MSEARSEQTYRTNTLLQLQAAGCSRKQGGREGVIHGGSKGAKERGATKKLNSNARAAGEASRWWSVRIREAKSQEQASCTPVRAVSVCIPDVAEGRSSHKRRHRHDKAREPRASVGRASASIG
jgi:hypothetical protein